MNDKTYTTTSNKQKINNTYGKNKKDIMDYFENLIISNKLQKISTYTLLLISNIAFAIKVIFDIIFFAINEYNSISSIVLKLILSLPIILGMSGLIFREMSTINDEVEDRNANRYFNELISILILLILILLFSFFLPEELKEQRTPNDIFGLILLNFFSVFCLITGLIIIRFLFKWLWIRKHKKTKKHFKIFFYSLLILILLEIPFHFINISIEDLIKIDYISIPIGIIELCIIILMFITAKKNSWVALLPKKKKWSLILYSTLVWFLCGILTNKFIENSGESTFTYASLFIFGSNTIFSWPVLLSLAYFLRVIFSAILALPTTKIVERQAQELDSLIYLNRLVAQSVNMNNLIDIITKLAIQSSGAIAGWAELYQNNPNENYKISKNIEIFNQANKDYNINICCTENIKKEILEKLYENPDFRNFFQKYNTPLYIDSIPVLSKTKYPELQNLGFANSLIAIPLFTGDTRLGTLIVLNEEEYGFENEDILVLNAFSHNLNVALENARLVEDSLEKERYKQELMLAKKMEEKLLPQILPSIKNFTIAGFSIPATVVGGDYYDIVKIKDGRNCIIIGDVSGKGMTAAFYMAQLKGVVLGTAKDATGAKDILKKINSTLYANMEKQMYITLIAIVIDEDLCKATIARAGHLPIIFKKQNNIEMLIPKGIGIGLAKEEIFNSTIEEIEIFFENNDTCLLFTDGITEFNEEYDNAVGYQFLQQILSTTKFETASELIEEIKVNIKEKIQKDTFNDDMTILALVCNKENKLQ